MIGKIVKINNRNINNGKDKKKEKMKKLDK